MTGFIGGFVQLIWFVYGVIALVVIVGAMNLSGTEKSKWGAGIVVSILFLIPPLGLGGYGWYTEWTLQERNRVVNEHFTKRCTENARVTIKRVIENVDGVFIMKPRKVANGMELQDQFWMGDPYGYSSSEAKHPENLLSYGKNGRYKLIEYQNPEFNSKPNAPQIIRLEGFELDKWGSYQRVEKNLVNSRVSKYGFDWDDISTPEDRAFWIAGGRIRIIDLETMVSIRSSSGRGLR